MVTETRGFIFWELWTTENCATFSCLWLKMPQRHFERRWPGTPNTPYISCLEIFLPCSEVLWIICCNPASPFRTRPQKKQNAWQFSLSLLGLETLDLLFYPTLPQPMIHLRWDDAGETRSVGGSGRVVWQQDWASWVHWSLVVAGSIGWMGKWLPIARKEMRNHFYSIWNIFFQRIKCWL